MCQIINIYLKQYVIKTCVLYISAYCKAKLTVNITIMNVIWDKKLTEWDFGGKYREFMSCKILRHLSERLLWVVNVHKKTPRQRLSGR